MRRRLARQRAIQALYAYALDGSPIRLVIQRMPETLETPNPDKGHFFHLLCDATVAHLETIDSHLAAVVENWSPERLNMVDRAALRLAVCEMLYFPDIPPRATINEYIEIAKTIGDDRSPVFINGVLDKVLDYITRHGVTAGTTGPS